MYKKISVLFLLLSLVICMNLGFAESSTGDDYLIEKRGTSVYKITGTEESKILEDVGAFYSMENENLFYSDKYGRIHRLDVATNKKVTISARNSEHKLSGKLVDFVGMNNEDKRIFLNCELKDGSYEFHEIIGNQYNYLNDTNSLNDIYLWVDRMTAQKHYIKGYTLSTKADGIYMMLKDIQEEKLIFPGIKVAKEEPTKHKTSIYYIANTGELTKYGITHREIVKIKGTSNVVDFELIKLGDYVRYAICEQIDGTYKAYKILNGDDAKYLGEVDGFNYTGVEMKKMPEYEEESTFSDEFTSNPLIDVKTGAYDRSTSYNGSLQSTLTYGNNSIALYKGKNFINGTIEANVVPFNGSSPHGNAGIIFRADQMAMNGEISNAYYLGVKPGSSSVNSEILFGKFINGEWNRITQARIPVNAGNNQKISVEAYGNHFKCYHDGKLVIDVYDNYLTKGKIGFRSFSIPAIYKNYNVQSAFVDEFTDVQLNLNIMKGIYNKVHQFEGSLQNIATDVSSVAICKDRKFKDGYIQTNMTMYRGDNIHGNSGIVFRVKDYQDDGEIKNGYFVGLKAGTSPGKSTIGWIENAAAEVEGKSARSCIMFGKFVDGQWHLIREVEANISYGDSHNQNLEIGLNGNNIMVSHDGKLIIDEYDSSFEEEGDIGFRSWCSSALYKNIKIVNEK